MRPFSGLQETRVVAREESGETTYVSGSRLSLQALALTLVPGVEGQDPASLGEPMAPGIRFIRHQDSSCRSLLPILCPQVTPSPLSQGEVAIDKGVSGWSLQSRADPFWFPPLVSTSVVSLGLGAKPGGHCVAKYILAIYHTHVIIPREPKSGEGIRSQSLFAHGCEKNLERPLA